MEHGSCFYSFDLNAKGSDDGDLCLLDLNIEPMVSLGDEESSHPPPLINPNDKALGVGESSHPSPLISLNVEASSQPSPLINLNDEALSKDRFCYASSVHSSFDLNVEVMDEEALVSEGDVEVDPRDEDRFCYASSVHSSFDLNVEVVDEEALVSEGDVEVDLRDGLPSHSSSFHMDAVENIVEDDYAEVVNVHEVARSSSNKDLSIEQRRNIYEALLQRSVNGKLKHGTTIVVASMFHISIRTVQRIWQRARDNIGCGEIVDLSSRRPTNCGRKRIIIDSNQFKEVPLRQRTNIRSLANALNIPKSTLFDHLKNGEFKRHTNAMKPLLSEGNMKSRLQFCISKIDSSSLPDNPIFSDMYNVIHIDEKWFYMSKVSEKYYLLNEEEEPYRTCKSKNFITKIMFLAAIARPRFDADGNEVFSGKIGIFPFITKESAKRRSKNRVAGTLETKPISSITKDVIRSYIIEKLLPAIRAKWPLEDRGKPIYIQHNVCLCKPKGFQLDAWE